MIRFIVVILILGISLMIGLTFRNDPGYVYISLHHWSIQTTFWFFLSILVLLFFCLIVFFKLLKTFFSIPKAIKKWHARHKSERANRKTHLGLIEFSEGNWSSAKNHLIQAVQQTNSSLINYLTAAKAAQALGQNQQRDSLLREAEANNPEAKIAIELTQASLQIEAEQWEQALATLKHLQENHPKHPFVLKLLKELYERLQDWSALKNLLPSLRSKRILSDEDYTILEKKVYLELLQSEGEEVALALPKSLKEDPDILKSYVHILISQNKEAVAEKMIRQALKKNYNDDLMLLYTTFKSDKAGLKFGESLLKSNPNSSILLLSLARMNKQHQLWGKAKTYYEESLRIKETPIAYKELGLLLEKFMHDPVAASKMYQKGLFLATN